MKTKIFGYILLLRLCVLVTGCVKTADGHMKAGVPFSKDKIVSRYERSVSQILSASRVVLQRNGQIQSDDAVSNSLKAKINQNDVWVKVAEVDPNISEVVVQARSRRGAGNVDLASEISKQIGIQLAVGQ